jgi:hypothetical protein
LAAIREMGAALDLHRIKKTGLRSPR